MKITDVKKVCKNQGIDLDGLIARIGERIEDGLIARIGERIEEMVDKQGRIYRIFIDYAIKAELEGLLEVLKEREDSRRREYAGPA